MRILLFVFTLIILVILSYELSALANSDTSGLETQILTDNTAKFTGICYGPYRDNEDPDFGIPPTCEEIEEDLTLLGNLTQCIRTYGIRGNLSKIPLLCQEVGIDCYPGAWISEDETDNALELQCLIRVANQNLSCIKGLIVGNEVLLRGDVSEDDLIKYVKSVKDNTTIPVSTAEMWDIWLSHPQLAENVDFIIVHIHPYWAGGYYYGSPQQPGGIPANDAAEHVVEKWKEVKARYPDKTIIIGETGWPTKGECNGDAIPSELNQSIFLSEFLELAENNSIQYFYFETFDEKWKGKHRESEANWGLYYSNGSLKPLLPPLIPIDAREGLSRPPRILMPKMVTAPFEIYTEVFSPDNPCCSENYSFYPTGYMGDLADWSGDTSNVLDYACQDSPHSGNTCIKITYSLGSEKWAGIYWQYPMNNWGDYPGYNISNATRLTFWARGEKGGEGAEFRTGGIYNLDKPYHDSFGPVSTDPSIIQLTAEWQKYSIDCLSKQNLSMAIGGFCWVTNQDQNPEGCTIYLDDIFFESQLSIFDTCSQKDPYPSIPGTHNGTITPTCNISGSKLYTYPCAGTGGHTRYVKIWNTTGWNVTAYWHGYIGDWHNISFNKTFTLYENETYNYTIITGSYPQIIHEHEFNATGGVITCTSFEDANGNVHKDWIPAIKLF